MLSISESTEKIGGETPQDWTSLGLWRSTGLDKAWGFRVSVVENVSRDLGHGRSKGFGDMSGMVLFRSLR